MHKRKELQFQAMAKDKSTTNLDNTKKVEEV